MLDCCFASLAKSLPPLCVWFVLDSVLTLFFIMPTTTTTIPTHCVQVRLQCGGRRGHLERRRWPTHVFRGHSTRPCFGVANHHGPSKLDGRHHIAPIELWARRRCLVLDVETKVWLRLHSTDRVLLSNTHRHRRHPGRGPNSVLVHQCRTWIQWVGCCVRHLGGQEILQNGNQFLHQSV